MDIKTPKVAQVKEVSGLHRVYAHSHIRGLGLDDMLEPRNVAEGLVGQKKARKAAGIVLNMIKQGQIAGRAILLGG